MSETYEYRAQNAENRNAILTKQRDELLAALKEARRWIGDGDMSDDATAIHHWSAGYAKAIADTDAAIARAESKV